MLDSSHLKVLSNKIDKYNKMNLGHFPTPLEPLERLSDWLDGPAVYVKRDDASGLGQGGNKIRPLEFLAPDALDSGANVLVTAGVIQSNSVRQVAATAAKVGIDCHFAMITDRVDKVDTDYNHTGNIFLDQLYGATFEEISVNEDKDVVLEYISTRLKQQGKSPYIVPYGCANLLGAIGYLNAALEIAEQIITQQLHITHLIHASGTGGTQAGLIVGFALLNLPIKVIGIDIDADEKGVRCRVTKILTELADEVGLELEGLKQKIIIEPNFSAGAYGQADEKTVEAITVSAKLEALTLDPVYSGKGVAGLIGLTRNGYFKKSDSVIFLHTGGVPAIYAYRSLFGY
ncbi:MAG: D-cysteine desulfhydrase family protein [Kangiellaceae bacterium]|nr:D-cysteine desulfhydrase family protein [Kangiellaceae bacterium]